jgi:hypothetical protein
MLEAKSAFQGTFPYLPDTPTSVFQLLEHDLVALLILLDFILPKFHSGARPFEKAAVMTVPEAALSEQNGLKARKRKIWLAGKIGPVKLEAESTSVEATPQNDFWPRIPSADPGHHPAANSRGYDVSH